MKILYDHQIFDMQNIGGISRYYFELVNRSNGKNVLGVKCSNNMYLQNSNFIQLKSNAGNIDTYYSVNRYARKIQKIRNRILGLKNNYSINHTYSSELLKNKDYDIFHPTYYENYFLKNLENKPFVLTVFDLIHEKYPELFGINDQTSFKKKVLINKAKKIIAISESTKKDLIEFYDLPEKKIIVTYLGADLPINNAQKNTQLLEKNKKYFLYNGSRALYKNFYFLIRSIAPLLIEHDINLICTGKPFLKEEVSLFENLGIENKVLHFTVEDGKLYFLYNEAIAFIFPSYYEGFGLPVLEAFQAGCPVLMSKTSSLPEIGGDGALYFDPKSQSEIISACKRIIESNSLRQNLIEKGKERLKKFSWDRCYDDTIEVYKSI